LVLSEYVEDFSRCNISNSSSFGLIHWFNATLAQLVERLIRNQQVAGSIPAGGSKESIT
jgi:hypothetical protein